MIFNTAKGRGIGSEGINPVTALELVFPRNLTEVKPFMESYKYLLQCMPSKNSLAGKKMQGNVHKANALDNCFCEMFSDDPDFISNFFLPYTLLGPTVQYLNFDALFDMLKNRYFPVNLPILLTISL